MKSMKIHPQVKLSQAQVLSHIITRKGRQRHDLQAYNPACLQSRVSLLSEPSLLQEKEDNSGKHMIEETTVREKDTSMTHTQSMNH